MKDLCTKDYNEHTFKSNNVLACAGISVIMYLLFILPIIVVLFKEFKGSYDTSHGNYDQLVSELLIINQETNLYVYASFAAHLFAFSICIIWFYYRHLRKETPADLVESVKTMFGNPKLLLFLLFSIIACFSISKVLQNFANVIFPDDVKTIKDELRFWETSKFLYFLISIILSPIYLEIGYRGLVLKLSQKAWGLIGCMIINTLLYSSYFRNHISFVCVIPLSILASFMAFMLNSILPGIILHMGINLLDFMLWLSFDDELFPTAIFVLFILFIIFGSLAFFVGKDLFIRPEGSGYFNVRLSAIPDPYIKKRTVPRVVWRVNLIHKMNMGSVMSNVSFCEKLFTSEEEAEEWLFEKGFVFGKNPALNDASHPYWFHNKDTATDYVDVNISEITINNSYQESLWDDKWVYELNNRKKI